MNTPRLLQIFLFFLLINISSIIAQDDTATKITGPRNGISAKGIGVDYHTPVVDGIAKLDNLKHAAEVGYVGHFNKFFGFGIPFKVGNVDLSSTDGTDFDSENFYSLDGLLRLQYDNGQNAVIPYLFSGIGATAIEDQDITAHLPIGAGVSFRIGKDMLLNLQGEYRLSFEDNRDHLHYGLGLIGLLGKSAPKIIEPIEVVPTDTDGDGVSDEEDACPNKVGEIAFKGCPDTDGDGIADKNDGCPDMAGLREMDGCPDTDGDGVSDIDDRCPSEIGPADNNGCPVVVVVQDADNDGFSDETDLCPNAAGPINGCPDIDGDGVADKDDRCPNIAGNLFGCPDTDNDGVADASDKCPNKAGTISNAGCPEIKQEEKEVLDLAMRAVQFETGSARLKSSSNQVLNQIADIMNRYPEYNLAIGGHTDHIGSSSVNQKLSERRAKACYDYLVKRGISSNRVSYTGYGEKQPIATNKYKDGREKNRRVEFNLFLK